MEQHFKNTFDNQPRGAWDSPSDAVWTGIESRLAKKRRGLLLWGFLGSIALASLTLGVFWLQDSNANPGQPSPENPAQLALVATEVPTENTESARQQNSASTHMVQDVKQSAEIAIPTPLTPLPQVPVQHAETLTPHIWGWVSPTLPLLNSSLVWEATSPTLTANIPPANNKCVFRQSSALQAGWSLVNFQSTTPRQPLVSQNSMLSIQALHTFAHESGWFLQSGIALSQLRSWQQLPVTLFYTTDGATEVNGRRTRNYEALLEGPLGNGLMELELTDTRSNEGFDLEEGRRLQFRVQQELAISYLGIPLEIGWARQFGRIEIGGLVGVQPQFRINANSSLQGINSERPGLQTRTLQYGYQTDGLNAVLLQAGTAFRLAWQCSPRWQFRLQPTYATNLSALHREPSRSPRYHVWGLQVGLQYQWN